VEFTPITQEERPLGVGKCTASQNESSPFFLLFPEDLKLVSQILGGGGHQDKSKGPKPLGVDPFHLCPISWGRTREV
jgi:hypothetical protein